MFLSKIGKTYKDKRADCVILALYLCFILISQILISDDFSKSFMWIGTVLIALISFVIAPVIISVFSRIEIKSDGGTPGLKTRLLLYGIPLSVMIIYYIGYYPGGFGNDAYAQLMQYVSNSYSDWHPFIQTLLFICLPIKLTGGWPGSMILFQVLVFSAAIGYAFESVFRYAGKRFTAVYMAYILLNPLLCFALNAWKDVAFAIGATILTSYALNIFFTGGAWIKKPLNLAAFVTVFVLTTLFRHNAVLFTVPLLFALFFRIPKKQFVIALIAMAALFAGIKGPLYMAFSVDNPPMRQVEKLGLPLTVIGDAVTTCPDELDEDIVRFAYEVTPQQIWEDHYVSGSFNSVKWYDETDLNVIEEYGSGRIIDMMMRCFKECPLVCVSSVIELTEGTYTVTDPHFTDVTPRVEKNFFAIPFIPDKSPLLSLFYGAHTFVRTFFPHMLYFGAAMLLLVISVLSRCSVTNVKDWRKILLALPLAAYNGGTSLLMTGFNDSPRFFYYTVLVVPILLVIYYGKEEVTE